MSEPESAAEGSEASAEIEPAHPPLADRLLAPRRRSAAALDVWITAASAAARASVLCTVAELLVERGRGPTLLLSALQHVYLRGSSFGLFALAALVLGALLVVPGTLIARRIPAHWRSAWSRSAGTAVVVAATVFVLLLLVLAPLLARRRAPFDFPAELDHALGFALALIAAAIAASASLLAALVPERWRSSRALLCAGLAAGVVALLALGGVQLARLQVHALVAPCVLGALVLALGAGLALPIRARRGEALLLIAAAAFTLLALRWSTPVQRELLIARSANLYTLLRWASSPLDLDGDGYWSTDVGGFDCDDSRFEIAPFAPDPPGDGVDQNCSGADAVAVRPRIARNLAQQSQPDLLLITVDALSARYVGAHALRGSETPQLDAWAKRGVMFERAYSAGTSTEFALTALLSGRAASDSVEAGAHTDQRGLVLRNGLADALRKVGYRTTCIPSTAGSLPLTGCSNVRPIASGPGLSEASVTALQLTLALDALRAGAGAPSFVWAHLMDPHASYQPRDPLASAGDAEARYRSEVRAVDGELAGLLGTLEREGRLGHTLVIVSADHGEELDGNGVGHGPVLRDDLLHVPLLLWGPAVAPARVREPVSALDVFPTMLAAAGARFDAGYLHGVNLLSSRAGAHGGVRAVFAEAFHGTRKQVAAIEGAYKLVLDLDTGAGLLVDLEHDPFERHNLWDQDPVRAARLMERIRRFRATPASAAYAR